MSTPTRPGPSSGPQGQRPLRRWLLPLSSPDPEGPPLAPPHLVAETLGLLGQEVATISQQQGCVSGGRRPGAALVLVQDGGQAAVLGGLAQQVGAATLRLQGAALGAPATAPAAATPTAAVQASTPLDGGPGADLLQHAVEGSGPGGQVVQGHGIGDAVHLRGALLLVRGVMVGHALLMLLLGILRRRVFPLP